MLGGDFIPDNLFLVIIASLFSSMTIDLAIAIAMEVATRFVTGIFLTGAVLAVFVAGAMLVIAFTLGITFAATEIGNPAAVIAIIITLTFLSSLAIIGDFSGVAGITVAATGSVTLTGFFLLDRLVNLHTGRPRSLVATHCHCHCDHWGNVISSCQFNPYRFHRGMPQKHQF